MNNIQPIAPQTAPVWPEVNAATAKSNMSAPQVGASEVPIRDSVIATGREMVREWNSTQSDVRPNEVKKALDWNADPKYPDLNVLNGIATLFVNSALTDGTIS